MFLLFREYISGIMFYLVDNFGAVVDARTLNLPDVRSLMTWFATPGNEVFYGNQDRYNVYVFGNVVPVSSLHKYDVNGYILDADKENMTNIIKDAWKAANTSEYHCTCTLKQFQDCEIN